MDVFSGVTAANLGDLDAEGIITSGLSLVEIVAPIVLIGLAIAFAPKLVGVVRRAFGSK